MKSILSILSKLIAGIFLTALVVGAAEIQSAQTEKPAPAPVEKTAPSAEKQFMAELMLPQDLQWKEQRINMIAYSVELDEASALKAIQSQTSRTYAAAPEGAQTFMDKSEPLQQQKQRLTKQYGAEKLKFAAVMMSDAPQKVASAPAQPSSGTN